MWRTIVLLAALSVALNVAAGNDCDVTEEPWSNALDMCSCKNIVDCQLSFDLAIACNLQGCKVPRAACKVPNF